MNLPYSDSVESSESVFSHLLAIPVGIGICKKLLSLKSLSFGIVETLLKTVRYRTQ